MFGIGFTELVLVSIIAILFLGPDKLPDTMVQIAKFIKSVKKTIGEAQSSLEEELKISDLKDEALKYKSQLDNATNELKSFKNIDFDYKLKEGKLKNRNAIKILQINDYPYDLIKEAIEISKKLDGVGTNNEAEYMIVIEALKLIQSVLEASGESVINTSILIKSDSALVIGQCSLGWKIKVDHLRSLNIGLMSLINKFGNVEFEKLSGDVMKSILGH